MYINKGFNIYFLTGKQTRKVKNIQENPNVSYSIFDETLVTNPPIGMKFLTVNSLVSWFPAIALALGVIFLIFFPLNKNAVKALQDTYKKGKIHKKEDN